MPNLSSSAKIAYEAKQKAIEVGNKKYFTGIPCKHGHTSERYVVDNQCVECSSIRMKSKYRQTWDKKHYNNNKHLWRDKQLQRTYGVTLEQYNSMLIEQQCCCYICGVHEQDIDRALAVDHCHKSGKVRKLLCGSCNTVLGSVKDDINILKRMILYIPGDL